MNDFDFSRTYLAELERRVAALEGMEEAAAFCSGRAAISTAILGLLEPGDHVVASVPLGPAVELFLKEVAPRFGIQASFAVAGSDTVGAIREEAARIRADRLRMIWIETPSDPTNALIDIEGVAHLADRLSFRRERRILTAVENSLLGPLFQRPAQHGADLVAYAESGVIAGAAVLVQKIAAMRELLGTSSSPFAAWHLLISLDTIGVRTQRQAETASCLAKLLMSHPAVQRVLHPSVIGPADPQHEIRRRQITGFGPMIAIEVKNAKEETTRVIERLELARADQPLPGLIRIRVGLEPVEDLERDLIRALDRVDLTSEREDVRTTQVTRVPIV